MKIANTFAKKGRFFLLCVLLILTYRQALGQACNCPPVSDCGACQGGLVSLTFRYDGFLLPVVITVVDQGGLLFQGLVFPGGTFTVTGSDPDETFGGDQVSITVPLAGVTVITTTCGTPVYTNSTYGNLTVLAGESKDGGAICCSDSDMENIPPVISNCPDDILIPLGSSGCTTPVSWTAPTAVDNCGTVTWTSTHDPGDIFSKGITPVLYTATDEYGNTSSCSFNVTVNDITAPIITGCIASDIIATTNGSCQANVSWTAPTATDNCVAVTLTTTHTPGSLFPKGTTQVKYTATDGSGNTSICTFNVIVNDNVKPIIAGCLSDIIVPANGLCQATVSWTEPTASDNCVAVTLTRTHSPGNLFPKGTTPVTYTATDGSGNTAVCTFNVIVNDNTNPVITGCPASDIVLAANASCQAIATWTVPTAGDNCGAVTLTGTHSSGNLFPKGTTQVRYTATDGSGNTSICTFNVIVNDTTDPVITGCLSDITLLAGASCQATATWLAPTATDNCGAVTLTSTHTSGSLFPKGTTQVKYTATDGSGNISVCTFNVIVNDNTKPVIAGCLSNITVPANASCQAAVSWTPPTASDNCPGVTLASTHTPGSLFPKGTTQVKYTATDASGNTFICTFNVIVNDNTKPVLAACSSDITASANASCKAPVTWTAPTATDNCGAVTLTPTHTPGSLFSKGTTQVTYTATDGSGNTSTCTFNVIVNDNTNPVISGCITSDLVVPANASCQATVSWAPPIASDNCSVTLASTHSPGSTFVLGTTQVKYTATDGSGNTSICTFNVIVIDNTNPVISGCATSDIVVMAEASCQAVVSWIPPTATDNCGAATLTSSHQPGQAFQLGVTSVTYTATNSSGNISTCTFNVVVKDGSVPIITGYENIVAYAGESCEAKVDWNLPVVNDCETITLTSSNNSGEIFPVGTSEVTYTAVDNSGNSASCTFKVVVEDKTAPVFQNCNSEIIVSAESTCTAKVTWTPPSVTDICGVTTVTSSHNPGDIFPIGKTEVKYSATDLNGNVSVCQFNIIVKNDHVPIISDCPNDIAVKANDDGTASVDWVVPTVTALCEDVTLTGSHQPGALFSEGTTVVEYKATDNTGHTAHCTFNVIVSYEEIEIEISKVVTPDGNGINDEWIVSNIEKFKDNTVTIVDRWGSVVFTASGYNNESVVWNGLSRNGSMVPTGTYFYAISIKHGHGAVEKSGFIELIR